MAVGTNKWSIGEALISQALLALPDPEPSQPVIQEIKDQLTRLRTMGEVWSHEELQSLAVQIDSYAMSSPSHSGLLGVQTQKEGQLSDSAPEDCSISSLVVLSTALGTLCMTIGQHGRVEVVE